MLGAALAVAALAGGCSDAPAPAEPETDPHAVEQTANPLADEVAAHGRHDLDGELRRGEVRGQLAELRQATARFHRPAAAERAGYTVLVTHPETGAACLEDPVLGAMGRHYLAPALIDGDVAVEAPEVLIYEPTRNGRLRLVAVEYVIPFAIHGADQPPPVLFGRELMQNHTFDLWALHAWVWKHNPSGVFADWNPRVSCAHDTTTEE